MDPPNISILNPAGAASIHHNSPASTTPQTNTTSFVSTKDATLTSNHSPDKIGETARPQLKAKRSQNTFFSRLSRPVPGNAPTKSLSQIGVVSSQATITPPTLETDANGEDAGFRSNSDSVAEPLHPATPTLPSPLQSNHQDALWEDACATWTWIDPKSTVPSLENDLNLTRQKLVADSREEAREAGDGSAHVETHPSTATETHDTQNSVVNSVTDTPSQLNESNLAELDSGSARQTKRGDPSPWHGPTVPQDVDVIDLTSERWPSPQEISWIRFSDDGVHIVPLKVSQAYTRPNPEPVRPKDASEGPETHTATLASSAQISPPLTSRQEVGDLEEVPLQNLPESDVVVSTSRLESQVESTQTNGHQPAAAPNVVTAPSRPPSSARSLSKARTFDSDAFDTMIYQNSTVLPPPEGVRTSGASKAKIPPSSGDTRVFVATNPYVHRMHNHSEEWHQKKTLEIKNRGGRKAWFGRAAERERWLRSKEKEKAAESNRKDPQVWAYQRVVDFGDVPEDQLPEEVLRDPAWAKACAWHRESPDTGYFRQEALKSSVVRTDEIYMMIRNQNQRKRPPSSQSVEEVETPTRQSRRRPERQ